MNNFESWVTDRNKFWADPNGWLSIVGFHWLTEEPTAYKVVPGLWSVNGNQVQVADVSLEQNTWTVVKGESTFVPVAELLIELASRSGRIVLRPHSSKSELLEKFEGIRHFDFDDGFSKAFLLTIPRETIIHTLVKPIWSGVQALGSLTRLPGQTGYKEVAAQSGSKDYTVAEKTRIAQAEKILSGYGFGAGKPLPVNLVFSANDALRLQEATLIQNSAALAGFKVTLSPTTTLGASRSNKTYDAHLYSWSRSDLGVTWAQKVFGYNTPLAEARANNVIGYNNPELNTLVNTLETNLSAAALTKQSVAIEKVLYADAV